MYHSFLIVKEVRGRVIGYAMNHLRLFEDTDYFSELGFCSLMKNRAVESFSAYRLRRFKYEKSECYVMVGCIVQNAASTLT